MEETREILGVGQSRPPEVLDHPKGWERGPVTGVRSRVFSGCDDGGILKWCVCFESGVVRLFGLASKVCGGGVREGRYGPRERHDAVLQGVA